MFARFIRGRTAFRRVVVAVLVATAVYAAVIGFHIGGRGLALWVDDLSLAVAAGAAGLAALFLAKRRTDRTRKVWMLMGLAGFLWAAGEVTWSVYELILKRAMPFPSVADGFYLTGTLFGIAAVTFLIPRDERLSGFIRRLLDGCILGASLLLISWEVVLKQIVNTSSGSSHFALGVSIAYPIGDVVTIAIVISIATHARQRRRQVLMILAAGMALQAVTDSLFVGLAAHNSYTGGFIDTGWFLGYLLIGLAALRGTSVTEEQLDTAAPQRLASVLVPFGAAVSSMCLAIIEEMLGHDDRFLFWCGSVIIVIVLVRLMLTIADNISLTHALETKIEKRTAELGSRERLFRSLVQNSSDVITVLDSKAVIASVSESAATMLNLDPASLIGEALLELIHGDDVSIVQAALDQSRAKRGGGFVSTEFRIRCGDGRWRTLETSFTNLLEDPDVRGLVLNSRDVSERKGLEAELTRQAFHDSLTDLPNRALFHERIEHALQRRDRLDRPLAVLFLDLDGFKAVNDTFGHEVGDELLRQVAIRLENCTRPGDTVARLGGDEFGILLEALDDPGTTTTLAERCLEAIREPFQVVDKEIFSTISIGIAITNALENVDEILRNADVAMYEVKSKGGGAYQLFDPRLHAALLQRVELARDLRGAVERGEFSIRLQPVYSLSDGTLEGAEALIRWEHPKRGEVQPDEFISIAEETGLIVPIGEWVLRLAALSVQRWPTNASPLKIAVNLSARQLQEADLPDRVGQILAETGIDPSRLILEITETALMQDTEETIKRLHQLKKLGIQLAIDDFGTGYSSLSYLRQVPADILKIDRSFVAAVDGGPEDSALTRAIVKLSATFGLHTVAEGIERPEQADVLKEMGCDFGQGYLYARPLSQADFEELANDSTRTGADLAFAGSTSGH